MNRIILIYLVIAVFAVSSCGNKDDMSILGKKAAQEICECLQIEDKVVEAADCLDKVQEKYSDYNYLDNIEFQDAKENELLNCPYVPLFGNYVQFPEGYKFPTMTVYLNGIEQYSITVRKDETVEVKIDWKTPYGIREIKLFDNESRSYPDYPKTNGFSPSEYHESVSFTVSSPTTGGRYNYSSIYQSALKDKQSDIIFVFEKIRIHFLAVED